jgi:aminoglycoside phosphotransferase (APT) family kinase protein
MRLTVDVLDLAKAKELPVPAQELVAELPDGRIVVVQERLPGNPIRRIDVPLVDALVAINDGFAGLLADRPDVPGPKLGLRQSGPDHPRHEALAGYDDRTRGMLARIRAIGETVPDELPGNDLVHPDFARGNVLVDRDGQISGVIDWSSAALRGDRAFALVSLRSDLEWRTFYDSSEWVPQSVVDRLDSVLRTTIEPTVLDACWAHWTLHKAYAAIRGGAAKELDMWLRLGDSWLP